MIIDSFIPDKVITEVADSIVSEAVNSRGYAVIVLVNVGKDQAGVPQELVDASNIIMSMDGFVHKAE